MACRCSNNGGDDDEQMYDGDDWDCDCDCDGWIPSEVDAPPSPESEKKYLVLNEDGLRARQEECTAKVAELLSVPPGFAAVLLRHYGWSVARLEDGWFPEERRVRDAVGLPPAAAGGGAPVAVAVSGRRLTCGVCFDEHPAGEMVSAGCPHFYCRGCWRGYVGAAVADGARCLSLRCPDTSCAAAVVRELVDEVAGGDEGVMARYAVFALRSYVEESRKARWCPAPRCDNAAELVAGERCTEPIDVSCPCSSNGFCLRCGEEAHRPATCEMARAWLARIAADSELLTASWIETNTKPCPECRRPIEKNHGCLHMACPPPCGHHFCWHCLGPWNEHHVAGEYPYACRRNKRDRTTFDEDAASPPEPDKRLRHCYARWTAHETARRVALDAMKQLQSGGVVAVEPPPPASDLDALVKAHELIAGCRRVLMWVYVYSYYQDPERDELRHELLGIVRSDAARWLERLQECVRRDTAALVGLPAPADGGAPGGSLKLADAMATTTTRFRKLVEACEDGGSPETTTTGGPGASKRRSLGDAASSIISSAMAQTPMITSLVSEELSCVKNAIWSSDS